MWKLLISLLIISLILQSFTLTSSFAGNTLKERMLRVPRKAITVNKRMLRVPRNAITMRRLPQTPILTGSLGFIDLTENGTTLPGNLIDKKKDSVTILADKLELGYDHYRLRNGNSPRNLILVANEIRVTGTTTFDVGGFSTMSSDKRTKQFKLPKNRKGKNLKWCKGLACGLKVAKAFCKGKNFTDVEALKKYPNFFKKRNNARGIFSQAFPRCTKPYCDAFEYITCRTVSKKKPRNPIKAQGGTISILARKLICDGGKLYLDAQGFKHRKQSVGLGGRIFLAFEDAPNGEECVKTDVRGSKQGRVQRETFLKKYLEYDKQNGEMVLARWMNSLLKTIAGQITEANALSDDVTLVALFQKFENLVKNNSDSIIIPPLEKEWWIKQVGELSKARKDLVPPLYSIAYTINDPMPRTILGFREKSDLKVRLAPTDALVAPLYLEGRNSLGVLQFDPDNNKVVLSFSAELRIDPLVEQKVKEKVVAEHQEYGGVFTNWSLRANVLPFPGMIDERIEMGAGNKLNVTLTIASNNLTVALIRLMSSGGIPFVLDYAYREKPEFSGQLTGLSLSLARQVNEPVEVKGDILVNHSEKPVIVDYLQSEEDFHIFSSRLVLPPGETKSSKIPQSKLWKVPAEAIYYEQLTPYKVHEDFVIVNDDGLFFDEIVVKNFLKFDENRGGAFESVQITVKYINEDQTDEQIEEFELTSSRGAGSKEKLTFFHRPGSNRKIIISGTAFFAGESKQTIKPVEFSSKVIRIRDDLLPPIEK